MSEVSKVEGAVGRLEFALDLLKDCNTEGVESSFGIHRVKGGRRCTFSLSFEVGETAFSCALERGLKNIIERGKKRVPKKKPKKSRDTDKG